MFGLHSVAGGENTFGCWSVHQALAPIDGRLYAAIVIKADIIIDAKAMALAGQGHINITIEPELDRPSGLGRPKGCKTGNRCSLGFLAAEPQPLQRDRQGQES